MPKDFTENEIAQARGAISRMGQMKQALINAHGSRVNVDKPDEMADDIRTILGIVDRIDELKTPQRLIEDVITRLRTEHRKPRMTDTCKYDAVEVEDMVLSLDRAVDLMRKG